MLKEIQNHIDALYPEMVEIRRYLHQNPELSFQEHHTAEYIADFYENLNIPYETGVGGNGVLATLKGGKPGKTIALRADFDALPIQEENDVDYRSKVEGVMHACGHDGHTASLLVLAKVLKHFQKALPGTVVFLHQHGEEQLPGGAQAIIASGKLDDVDAIFGQHLWATVPLGEIQTSQSALMSGADAFEITIHGQGGHGGYPHETKDALIIAAELVSNLQTIVSRQVNPLDTAVLSVGKIESGSGFNVIADSAKIHGTVRYLDESVQKLIIESLERIVKGTCYNHDSSYEINYTRGYPALINHATEASLVYEAAQSVDGVKHVAYERPVMGGEDFAYYTAFKPGAFFFTGALKEGHAYPHHHPKFDIDEGALPIAAKTLIASYFAYQNK